MTHIFAGASLSYWIAFHVIVVVLLVVDLIVLQRKGGGGSIRAAWGWTAVVAALAFCFALFLSQTQGKQPALEFLSGYLVEGSLSVDNLFVFLLMFRTLKLNSHQQHHVLLWGILGAIVMRALFIVAGTSLLMRFAWVEYVFGAFLLYAAVKLMQPAKHDSSSGLLRWLQSRSVDGAGGKIPMSSFLMIVLAVEATDLIFALDSIPAVLAITRDTFVVYTSNIFAILGLRSLYFALSNALDKLRLLHYGLAVILAFVGLKMIASHWIEIPVTWSLLFIVAVLGAFTAASLLTAPKESQPKRSVQS
ncbi:TerC/Alx family metal homeostasis membrane protein [Silvibacterium acidisoli]|uniref:TerC/Alx family metal homeostasis membrane protein n=1 Tax=Acidobacteriaceae bacterium ZG23-2 TaxID=2883246 RepID=UPI00406C0B12